MDMKKPRLSAVLLTAPAAMACAAFMGAYFGAGWGSTSAFIACWLLFLGAGMVHPDRRTLLGAGLLGTFFALMSTLGYSYETLDSYGLLLKNADTLKNGALACVSLAVAASAAVILLLALLEALRRDNAAALDRGGLSGGRLFALCAVILFVGAVPYLILYAPGLNIFDTHDQLLQFFGYPSYIGDGHALSDHHPVLLTLLYGGFMQLGLLLGDANMGQLLYSLLSMAAIACCYAYALCVLRACGLCARGALCIAAGVALYPVLALYAFNMCKDVSVAPFVLLFTALMIRLEHTRGDAARSTRFLLALFVCAMLLMMMRKSAMASLLFAAVFLIGRYRGVRVRLGAVLLGAVLLFQVGYTGLLLPACGVIPGETREMLSVPFQQTARCLITYPDDVTPQEAQALSRVIDIEYAKAHYDPRLSDAVKDSSNPQMTGEDLRAYFGAWLSMGLRHPGTYVDAFFNMIFGYFYPSQSNTIVCLTLNSPDQGGLVLRQSEAFSGARAELFDIIYFVLRRIPGIGQLFYVDTVTWLFLLLLLALVLRGGLGAATPFTFFLGTLGICLLSPKSGEIRYLMPVLYALPLMLGMALIPDGKEKPNA